MTTFRLLLASNLFDRTAFSPGTLLLRALTELSYETVILERKTGSFDVSNSICRDFAYRFRLPAFCLTMSQRFDGIELGRLSGWIDTGRNPHKERYS